MSVLIFILILSFLVIIHEMGHFLTAKWQGIKVEEFGIGYPPQMKTLYKDKQGTAYTINWLPFGGFVRLFGEDEAKTTPGAFASKSTWRRLLVILAGASVNFIFGAIAFGAIYTKVGIPTDLGEVRLEAVTPDSPAGKAGLKEGDRVRAITVKDEVVEIKKSDAFIKTLSKARGQTVEWALASGMVVPVYVRPPEETPPDQGATGVVVSDSELRRYPVWEMPFRGMWVGVGAALDFGWRLLTTLGQMVKDLVLAGKVPADVAGPVGIAYAAQKDDLLNGWLAQINFAAVLSINLAIVNVLPLPALDGGRAVFILWEMIFRRRVSAKVEQMVNSVGFSLLLGLIVLISIRDIQTVFGDEKIQQFLLNLVRGK